MQIENGKAADGLPQVRVVMEQQGELSGKATSILFGLFVLAALYIAYASPEEPNRMRNVVWPAIGLAFFVFCVVYMTFVKAAAATTKSVDVTFAFKRDGEKLVFTSSEGIEIPAEDLRAFSATTEEEWTETADTKNKKRQEHEVSLNANHWLILAERNSSAPIMVARHIGSKSDTVQLHDTLTRQFLLTPVGR
jgi:hypothetical protein